ncbi:MAG: hypothetical protein P8R54_19950 [Myxococcota bacterium]|nr:hypothetical protein [Myxococcota bacterium]
MNQCGTIKDEAGGDDLELLAESAEEVRAYLVNLRGGAPFLSGADSQLLDGWLTDGVPVAVIMASMDKVAVRRRKRRVRSRMSLNSCRGEVRRLMGSRPSAPAAETHIGLLSLAGEISAMTIAPGLSNLRHILIKALTAISEADGTPLEDRARLAIRACRKFHEGVWFALTDQHTAMLADATAELDALRSVLKENAWQAAVEEVARDRIRARFPLISAQEVWERLSQQAAA